MFKWLNNERTVVCLSLTAIFIWGLLFGLQVRNFYVQRQRDVERAQKLDELNASLQTIVDEITKGQQQ